MTFAGASGATAGELPRLAARLRAPKLHTRVGVALGTLILALALVLAGMMSQTAETQVVRLSAANLTSLATQMARELAVGMDRFAQAAMTQTDRDLYRSPDASAASMRDALERFQRTNPEFAYVSIVDIASAKVIAATGGVFEGGNARGRPTFDEGRNGLFVGDVHDAVRLAELLPKPSNGEALRFLDVAAPITDASGKAFRVFATHVAWQWTSAVRADIFGPVKAESGVDAFLTDTEGKVVLAAVPSIKVGTNLSAIAALAGRPASVVAWPDGGDYLTVVSATAPHGNFPGFGWKVVARQPVGLAAAAASDLRTAFLVGALLLGLGGAALAWIVTGRLVRPVHLLAQTAAHAQAGQPIADAAGVDATPETALVHTAMVRLADTARLEAEANNRSQRQFAVLAESLPQVVFQTDAAGRVDYINKGWLKDDPARGRVEFAALADLMAGDRDAFLRAWRHSLASGDALNLRCRISAPACAAPRWFDVAARTVTSDGGQPLHWVGTVFDVHDMTTRAEEARRLLEQERDARLEAERAARMRDDFLATVSHELRSPLSVITGWSDILKRKGTDNPMVVKAAEVIRINARLQSALINDLLDITAVMAGKLVLNREPVDLSRLAEEVVLSHLHSAQTRGVALACHADLPVLVNGDRLRLTQVIANLVGNAIKFTDAGGAIEVTVAGQGSAAVAKVSDTGRGIAPDFLPHVFERMRQEDASVTRRAGGLGLGLAIVQGLVGLHGGSVEAHSDGAGLGSVFTVTVPLASETLDAAGTLPNPHDGDDVVIELVGQRILLVDDEAAAREVAQVALSSLGAEVRTAASAGEALRLLEHERFDVLVSDIGMPEMDGLTLLRTVRALPDATTRALPAVALTAFAMESHRLAGIKAGFQAYVAKPISLRRLSEAVATAVAEAGRTAKTGG